MQGMNHEGHEGSQGNRNGLHSVHLAHPLEGLPIRLCDFAIAQSELARAVGGSFPVTRFASTHDW